MNRTKLCRVCGVAAMAVCSAGITRANSPPVVSNLTASQRTDGSTKVDIRYDLTDPDGDACMVTVEASNDGGQTWTVPLSARTGAVGPGVTPGTGKLIVWDCLSDLPGWTGPLDLGLTAADGASIVGWGAQVVGGDLSSGFVAVAAGAYHNLGLKADGSIVAWGHDFMNGPCDVPSPNSGFVAVAAGERHSLGLKADGSIVAWGDNWDSQCNVPLPNTDFVAVAAGGWHSLGLKADGSVVACGWNKYGQCNVPSSNTAFVAVAGGYYHSLGLEADGSIVAWGGNWDGQCSVPSPNTDFVAVAGGGWHSLGLKADGSVVAWGANVFGECNVPSPNRGFVAIAGGSWHSLSVKADGSIVAWGENNYGQCNVPSPNRSFAAVEGGFSHSLGLGAGGGGASTAVTQVVIDNAPPRLTGAVSRRAHGAAGDFDIDLPLDPPESAGVECRAGGPTAVILTFSEPVAPGVGGSTGGRLTDGPGPNQKTVLLTDVADQTCLAIYLRRITDLVGNPQAGDNNVHVCVLAGDVTGDRVVNLEDLAAIKSQLFDPLTQANFRTDVYPDAVINIVDLQTVKGSSQSPGLLFHTAMCP